MSLPVSHYEALLAEVRSLRRKTQRVQELATPLISICSSRINSLPPTYGKNDEVRISSRMDCLLTGDRYSASSSNCDCVPTSSEDEYEGTRASVSSEPIRDRGGTWPVEKNMWNSEPTPGNSQNHYNLQEITSVMSFASSSGGGVLVSPDSSRRSSQQLEAKVDMVYSLLAMLSGQEHADMGETLLALSTNPESCLAMRQSGCIPLLVQMVQSDKDPETRKKASQALHNLVHSQPDEKQKKREVRIFKLVEGARAYTEAVRSDRDLDLEETSSQDGDKHPVQTIAHLMKLSFDESHRQAICQLGGIHVIANLVEVEHAKHGSTIDDSHCILMRRYACMALTNLTFGDSGNKALLCSFRDFMRALVIQLQSSSDELRQVTASVLRNLSWRADSSSKEILREVGSVTGLMKSAMLSNKENTLKSILSALWNLSAHCTENKSEICSVEGALGLLVDMLTYKTPSKSLAIIENTGGILRNISSQIAVRDDYREILRRHNCLQILLNQLKSPSLTIVSNACGTLWNLSAKSSVDQEELWQLGAPGLLRSLNHSKHKMIAMGSSAALKNLLSVRPSQNILPVVDSTALSLDLPVLPTLGARKQKALLQDLDQSLSETYENIERDSPVKMRVGEPSTSSEGKSASLPSGIPSFVKSKVKKSKEVNNYLDEKDHCSVDETSDTDNQSSLERRLISGDSGVSFDNFTARNHPPSASNLSNFSLRSQNTPTIIMPSFEIDLQDISVHLPDEWLGSADEKQDVEKEKSSLLNELDEHFSDFIGIPESSLLSKPKTQIPRSRRGFSSSTPLRINFNGVGDGSETCKVRNIDLKKTDTLLNMTEETIDNLSANVEKPRISSGSVSKIQGSLNISLEHNNSVPEESPDSETNSNSPKTKEEPTAYLDCDDRDRLLERSCDETSQLDNRMLDPDAMIESLERFTAELVSQASHLQNDEKFKDNTWNEDSSKNSVSFPSISGSAPNVVTFSYESPEDVKEEVAGPPEVHSNDFSSKEFSSLGTTGTVTESTLIAQEAMKMATVFQNEAEMSHSISSVASLELDKVQPPQLVESFSGNGSFDVTKSPKLAVRKISLPRALMVKRALSCSFNNNNISASSLDSLENQSLSNLDHINPPSMLGEVLDMDGSIVSVMSLTSELNRGLKESGSGSVFQPIIDNINPPSLFNDITDLCNSLADIPTSAIGSETEMFEDCNTHIPTATEDDVTEFSDANSATPIQSDASSSPETSPKRFKCLGKQNTSKLRRNLARDRYKTYTIAAEMATREEGEEKQSTSEDFKTVDCFSEEYKSVLDTNTYVTPRKTARERRQADRARYETRVVSASELPSEGPNLLQEPALPTAELLDCETLSLVSIEDDSERTNPKSRGAFQNTPEAVKPKIVKPPEEVEPEMGEEAISKGIRGRRKPLYSKYTNRLAPKTVKPIRSVTSNLVKNVTSTLTSARQPIKSVAAVPQSRASSGYGTKTNTPKTSPARTKKPLERQGTFTKDEVPKSRIPTAGGALSKIPQISKIPSRPRTVTSTAPSSRTSKNVYTRSTSADSREAITNRKIQNSASSQSLKSEIPKKTGIPHPPQRSGGHVSTTVTNTTKKQVTSKIASLWKKIEESKNKQPMKKDTRVWIQNSEAPTLMRSNTFDQSTQ